MLDCGKQVIATNYSVHTEFCNDDNCFLIEMGDVEPAFDDVFFYGQGNWAKFESEQMEQLIDHMFFVHRYVVGDNKFGLETANKFTWKNTAETIIREIE